MTLQAECCKASTQLQAPNASLYSVPAALHMVSVSMHEKRLRELLVPLRFSVLCTGVALCRVGEGRRQFAVNSIITWEEGSLH